MYAAKIVVGEMQRTRGLEIIQLLAKAARQPSESADRHPHPEILPLHETSRDMAKVGPTVTYFDYSLYHWGRGVPSCRTGLAVVAIQFYQLCETATACCLSSTKITFVT